MFQHMVHLLEARSSAGENLEFMAHMLRGRPSCLIIV